MALDPVWMDLTTPVADVNSSETIIHTRPTWAEVARGNLLHNHRRLRQLSGDAPELLVVVKANAYGHGLANTARVLEADGAHWFGVTSVEEGVALRHICPRSRILIMSGIWEGEAETAIDHRLTPVVWDPQHLNWLAEAARRRGLRAGELPVHLEIDTGMSRQGAPIPRLGLLLDRFAPGQPLRLEAITTHFHSPENEQLTAGQMAALVTVIDTIHSAGLRPEILSAGSSATILRGETALIADLARRIGARPMLRPGIALYGYAPSGQSAPGPPPGLDPVLAWKTHVTSLRSIDEGATVGYDATFTAPRNTRLALLPVGYADGLNRLLSNRGSLLIRGQHAPIVGRISMDQTMVDVTDISSAALGDEAVLIGRQGSEKITAADMANLLATIAYEVLCAIAARVPRVMVE